MKSPNPKTHRSIWSTRIDRLAWARDSKTFRWVVGAGIATVLFFEWVGSGAVFSIDTVLAIVPWVLLAFLVRWLARA